jgi:HK97 family phage prohead protease
MKAKIEHKRFSFEVEELKQSDDGTRATFKGYASTFGNEDFGGDIVAPGAFTKSIGKRPTVMVLADHTATVKSNIGFGMDMSEDAKGLITTTELNLEKDAGRETYAMLKQAKEVGYKIGLSIGFQIEDSDFDQKTGIRTIKEVTLWEYSVVIFPMNPKATVTAVKTILQSGKSDDIALLKRGIERHLREEEGFSKSEAEAFVSGGFRTLGDQGEKSTVDAINQLTERLKP